MDELELAKRAIRRNLLTEEQLREAQGYAQGGRPLVAVLLDLGFLKPGDLQALFVPHDPASRPPGRTRMTISIALTAVLTVVLAGATIIHWAFSSPSRDERPGHPPPPVIVREAPKPPPLCDQLAAIAADYLADAERHLREVGPLTPKVRDRLARGAALYEEAIRERPGEVFFRLQLGRARELLDQWEVALQVFRQVVEAHPDNGPALVGAARCQLLLQRHEGARADADRACSVAPTAEAFLVRARALRSLGHAQAADRDFQEAQRRDPTIAGRMKP